MDEDTQVPAENEQAVEDNSQPTSPVDETTTSESTNDEGQTEQAPINEPVAVEPEVDTERKPSRAERRIRELNDKVKQLEESNQTPSFMQPPQLDVEPGAEISPEQYRQHVAQEAQAIANQTVDQRIQHERAINNFDTDSKTLPQEYPEIESVPGLEEAIAQEFQDKAFRVTGVDPVTGKAKYQLDPSVRLADIAKKYVNVARAAAKQSSAATQQAVAESADTTAIKPTGETRQDKPLSEMSIEELEAKVGYHNG